MCSITRIRCRLRHLPQLRRALLSPSFILGRRWAHHRVHLVDSFPFCRSIYNFVVTPIESLSPYLLPWPAVPKHRRWSLPICRLSWLPEQAVPTSSFASPDFPPTDQPCHRQTHRGAPPVKTRSCRMQAAAVLFDSGRPRTSPTSVSNPSWSPRSPLLIPCLASTLARLSCRWFEPPELSIRSVPVRSSHGSNEGRRR
jgi:hypothetical protein